MEKKHRNFKKDSIFVEKITMRLFGTKERFRTFFFLKFIWIEPFYTHFKCINFTEISQKNIRNRKNSHNQRDLKEF